MVGRSTRSASASSIAKSALPYEQRGSAPLEARGTPLVTCNTQIVQAGAHKY
jgi:hypothetical protein